MSALAKELILLHCGLDQSAADGAESALYRRSLRAIHQFQLKLKQFVSTPVPRGLSCLVDYIAHRAAMADPETDLWADIRVDCEREFSDVHIFQGTLAQAIEWETIKLQSRIRRTDKGASLMSAPLLRDRHVHIATLLKMWRRLALDTEEWLAAQGYYTLLDVGPWGGFNFVIGSDGYTRMPFARLTLAIGGLWVTPLYQHGGPLFEYLLPRYHAALEGAGFMFPDIWQYQFPKHDPTGRLVEISGTHYLPTHTYDHRTFIKVRVSRAVETVEEMTLRDFLILVERLQFTTDWNLYREQTKDVDARFDLQDFISLNHMIEGIYQRSSTEERLLKDIKEAFRDTIRSAKVLYDYLEQVIRSRWVENVYWALAEASLGVRKYQRFVSFDREVCPQIPPRLLIPVSRHLHKYHTCLETSFQS